MLGPLKGASHVRTVGLHVYIICIRPKDPKTTFIELKIPASEIHSDVQNSDVFTFVMHADQRRFGYTFPSRADVSGNDGGDGAVLVNSFVPSPVFADPTPFTQWMIDIKEPKLYDLSGVTDVKLVWRGTMRRQ